MIEKLNLIWTYVDVLWKLAIPDEKSADEVLILEGQKTLIEASLYTKINSGLGIVFFVMVLVWWSLVAMLVGIALMTLEHIKNMITNSW
jgi:hypothetical protein